MYDFGDRPFMIDDTPIPTPVEYSAGVEDLSSEETGRTLDGEMHKDVVAVKDYYDCKWGKITWDDLATLLTAIDGKASFEFTHADPKVPGEFVTGTYYVGARTTPALDLTQGLWQGVAFKFVQV